MELTTVSIVKQKGEGVYLVAIYSTSSFMSASVSLTPTVVLVRWLPCLVVYCALYFSSLLLPVALDTTFRLVGAAALFLVLVLLFVFDLVAFFLTIGQMK
jgi:hypothetical protein